MTLDTSLALIIRKRNGADDPAGDDRGGDNGNSGKNGSSGLDDSSSGSSSASSASSAASSASSASSTSSSASTSDSSAGSASSVGSSASSASSSASSASSSASASNSSSDDSSSASAAASSSSSVSSDSSASAASGTSGASSASSGASSASSGAASASSSTSSGNDDSGPEYGRHDSFLFDAEAYLALNADLAATVNLSSALSHFMTTGGAQDRNPTRWFDADFYRESHGDLSRGGFDDATLFQHYNLYGVWEGRAPSAVLAAFDGSKYLKDNPDVAAYVNAHLDDFLGSIDNGAIAHFMIYGSHEGRSGFDDSGHRIDPGLFA